MRIISGFLKGRRLNLPKNFTARPTTDLARESIFNVLQNSFNLENCSALDLFSGAGGISFEFASRGALKVVSVEKNYKHYRFIKSKKEEFGLDSMEVIKMDAFKYIYSSRDKFDIVFADPPYNLPELDSIPEKILQSNILSAGGWLILEHPDNYNFENNPCFILHKRYSAVNFSIFERNEHTA